MRVVCVLLFVSALYAGGAGAQSSDTSRAVRTAFYSVQQVGLVYGAEHPGVHLNLVGGVMVNNRLAAGLAAGYNSYMVRTMPVFIDLRYTVGHRNTKAFAFGGGGLNLFPTYSQRFWSTNQNIVKRQTGTYGEAGVGFKTRLGNSLYYNTSFSYIYKKSRYTADLPPRFENGRLVPGGIEKLRIENVMFAWRIGLDF